MFKDAGQITGQSTPDMCAAREMTVGELIDRRIAKSEQVLFNLRDLKSSLPGNFLNSGASRIAGILEL